MVVIREEGDALTYDKLDERAIGLAVVMMLLSFVGMTLSTSSGFKHWIAQKQFKSTSIQKSAFLNQRSQDRKGDKRLAYVRVHQQVLTQIMWHSSHAIFQPGRKWIRSIGNRQQILQCFRK